MDVVDGILYFRFGFPPLEVSTCWYLRLKLLISGCGIFEEGCECTSSKLPKSSLKAAMSPSQCHLTCIKADLLWPSSLSSQFIFIWWLNYSSCCVSDFVGGPWNRWSLCSDDTSTCFFSKYSSHNNSKKYFALCKLPFLQESSCGLVKESTYKWTGNVWSQCNVQKILKWL